MDKQLRITKVFSAITEQAIHITNNFTRCWAKPYFIRQNPNQRPQLQGEYYIVFSVHVLDPKVAAQS